MSTVSSYESSTRLDFVISVTMATRKTTWINCDLRGPRLVVKIVECSSGTRGGGTEDEEEEDEEEEEEDEDVKY